eukprot:CAMPEP_0175132722 /NCGR_PEP_ID=MMETSP0087-20121206/7223_1 /TAXON_ID=136419 /ORGANISM="Unknown Unknown, Strain D1" /LENGTH=474 /DNA_ID=CAMNT_0016415089 /DNA_START=53 /DNA_END=1475 /DNA_ORIENTATION=+
MLDSTNIPSDEFLENRKPRLSIVADLGDLLTSEVEHSSFGQLAHNFPEVEQQLKDGLYIVRRVKSFCSKLAKAQMLCVENLEKAIQKEALLGNKFQRDGMKDHVDAVITLHSLLSQTNSKGKTFASNIEVNVVQPLDHFYTTGESELRSISQEYVTQRKKIEQLKNDALRKRHTAVRCWKELVGQQKQINTADPKKKEKIDVKISKGKVACKKAFRAFEVASNTAVAELETHYALKVPALLEKMNSLEVQRLFVLHKHLSQFVQIFSVWNQPEKVLRELKKSVSDLDTHNSIDSCITKIVQGEGEAPSDLVSSSVRKELPCESTAFDTDVWRGFIDEPVVEMEHQTRAKAALGTVRDLFSHATESMHLPKLQSSTLNQAYPPHPAPAPAPVAAAPVDLPSNGPAVPGELLRVFGAYDFKTDDPEDLTFQEGQVIIVMSPPELPQLLRSASPEVVWCTGHSVGPAGQLSSLGSFP